MNAGQAFELAEPMYGTIHELRATTRGIRFLEQTGRFREYMHSRVPSAGRRFVAWDGEGWSDIDNEHRYMLMMASTGDHIEYPRLDSRGCLELLLKVAGENPKCIHVIYGGGYDVTHWVRDLPIVMRSVLFEGGRVVWSVDQTPDSRINTFTMEYLPHKWFILSGFDWHSRKWVRIKLFDVMTFFQSSFVTALESRNLEVPSEVVAGKSTRAEFTFADLDTIKQYCQLELEKLVELCDTLRSEFEEAGLNVTQYHGPGAVASAVFKSYGTRHHMRPPEDHIEQCAQGAYFGGRFEQFKAGHYEGRVYVYDINSAYPHHIRNLPSLHGCVWKRRSEFVPGSFGVWFCSHDNIPDYTRPHISPWRGNGGAVGFPAHNAGTWLWTPEASIHRPENIHEGWILVGDGLTRNPFAFVEGLYVKRQEWKRANRGGERALKLALNSLYGKMAQRVGGSDRYNGRPPWHQLEWAGYVTSATRAQLWSAISQRPEAIIAVETDSVTTTEPLDLDCGSGLGQWELTEYDWITYVQSGVYFTSGDAKGMKAKSRGIDVRELDHDAVMAWLDDPMQEPLLVKTRNFIALGNPRPALYGQWIDSVKELVIGGGKRLHLPAFCGACDRGSSFSTELHTLIANPLFGLSESTRHSLPWRTDPFTPIESDAITEPVEAFQ